MCREHYPWSRWHDSFDYAGSLKSIHFGHGEIEDDYVGMEFLSLDDCLSAILSFGAHDPARIGQRGSYETAYQSTVIDDENRFHINQIPTTLSTLGLVVRLSIGSTLYARVRYSFTHRADFRALR